MPSLTWIFKTATGRTPEEWSQNGELDWYATYADGTDAGKGILTADWNRFPKNPHGLAYSRETADKQKVKSFQEYNWSRKGKRFQDILEHYGYQLEWMDQIDRCGHCGGCITRPDYYGDSSHYVMLGDCDIVCESCFRDYFVTEYLEGLEDNPQTAVSIRGVDPTKHGYHLISRKGEYETGMHPGQTDDPEEIYKEVTELGYTGIVFRISDSGQFDTHWEVYAKGLPKMADWQRTLTMEYETDATDAEVRV